ncbi:MAG: hypothetical protein WA637_24785 [Terriglobales bacterium]
MGKELILFHRDCYVPFQSLDLVRFHGAPELLDQGTAPVPEFAWTRFCHPEPVIRRKAILFNAIALEMRQPNSFVLRYPPNALVHIMEYVQN